jgi:hypothetical protein
MYSTPLPSPNDVSRVSTEIDPLPSVHHSVYTQGTNDRDHEWGDKDHHHAYGLDGDEKDIYAAPALNRNQSETKQVGGFWRRFVPSTWVCRLLILVVILESLVDLAILVSPLVLLANPELTFRPISYGGSITPSSLINLLN